jgi:DMSO/TMAO reductase YedYZ molybdopterin-dependent catalytic subunit
MSSEKEKIVSQKEINKKSILSFAFFLLMITFAITGWHWLRNLPKDNGAYQPLRTVLNTNEGIFKNFVFSENNLAKSYPLSDAVANVRVNGNAGLSNGFDTASWKLQVVRKPGDTLFISLNELKALPKTDVIFDFKCIEGWSQVTHWSGVRFSDFIKYYHLEDDAQMNYVGLSTPDNGYYVGIDNKSMLQPQTILCYEMNNAPLPMNQGYPLRLIIPVKYGVKHLKRIGTIYFSNERPPDYWYQRGYDYYSGL